MSHKQLFCFTYAGGTAAFFDVIEPDLDVIDLIKMEYAGHGTRHKEDYYHNFGELADDIFGKLKKEYLGGEYALFGYSMGSITLVEILKKIFATGMPKPSNLFLAAHEPHTKIELLNFQDDELDEWVKERTVKFGAVPEKLLNNRVFWRTYLPMYLADYMIIGRYEFEKLNLKTDIPATVFYSETDTPFNDMKLWEQYFPCDFYQFSGNHFFILQHHEEMGRIVRSKMGV